MACDPNALANASKCFQCLDDKELQMVIAYSLAVKAGGSLDPNVLVKLAAPFQALSMQQLAEVQAYLLCKISGG